MAALCAMVQATLQDTVAGGPACGRGLLAAEPLHRRLWRRQCFKSAVCTTSYVQHRSRGCWRSGIPQQRTLPHPQGRGPDNGQAPQGPVWQSCGHSQDDSSRDCMYAACEVCMQWRLHSPATRQGNRHAHPFALVLSAVMQPGAWPAVEFAH